MTAELKDAEQFDAAPGQAIVSYLARQPSSAPWTLLSLQEQRNRILIEQVSVKLDTIATVVHGMRTGANDIFVLEVEQDDGTSLARVRNGIGEQWFIERDLLEPVVFGSEVQRFTEIDPVRKLIYPYRSNVPLHEDELRERYPRAHEYLNFYKDLLLSRSSLKNISALPKLANAQGYDLWLLP